MSAARHPLRRIATSVGWMLADRGARLVGGFVVGLWLARYLGPADFGLYGAATATTFFGVVATQLGLDGLVQRELVRRPRDTGVILGTVTALAGGFAVLAWGLLAAIAATFDDPVMRRLVLWLALLVVPQALAAWEYLFQSRSDLRPVVLGQNLCFFLCLALRALLIWRGAPVTAFAIVVVAERLAAALVVIAWATRRHHPGRLGFDPGLARAMLKESWPVWISALLTTLYQKADLILVAHWRDAAEAGVYAAAMRVSELWWSISMIIATAVLPDLVSTRERSAAAYHRALQKYLDASVALSLGAAVAMTFLARPLVALLFGPSYADSAGILTVHFWTAIFIYLSVVRSRHLITSGRRLVELWFALGGVTLNLGANALLIPRFGAIGAAWAGLLTQAGVAMALPLLFTETRPLVTLQIEAFGFLARLGTRWREIRASTR